MTYGSYSNYGSNIEQVTSTAIVNPYGDFSQAYYSPQQYSAGAVLPPPAPAPQPSGMLIMGLGLSSWAAWAAGLL